MITSIHLEDDILFLILTDCLLFLNVCIRVYYFYKTFGIKKVTKYEHWISRILAFVSLGCLLVCLALYNINTIIFHNDTFRKYTQFNFPVWLRWFGAVLLLAANIFFYIVHYYLDRSWSGFIALLEDHKLIKNGPYRYIRHPMYTSILLIVISIFFLTTSWLLTITFLFVFITVTLRIPKEESIMLNHFGDVYREYKKTTGMLFPPASCFYDCFCGEKEHSSINDTFEK